MSHSLIMSDNCLLILAKNAVVLIDSESLIQFLTPWYRMEKYHLDILACLQSTLLSNTDTASSKLKQKAALKATWVSKQIKYMDDPVVTETAKIIAMRNQWLVEQGKVIVETKTRLKKAIDAEKKEREKADKAKEKSQ